MKLIKKIAAIMFAFMMVVSMSCNVKADEGTTATTETGKITINNAVDGQTYTIYKLLDLESYDKKNNNYSYKPAKGWEKFIDQNTEYFIKNEYDGISWKANESETEAQAQERASILAKKALNYAKDSSNSITNSGTETADSTTVTFSGLDLGYYLVDSSVGALCSLNTTNTEAIIQEKNDVPTVVKRVHNKTANENGWNQRNFSQMGDTIEFKTTITTKAGAQNYILHDKLDNGFTLNQNSIKVMNNSMDLTDNDYTISFNNALGTDIINQKECTFHIVFSDTYCSKVSPNTEIEVTYDAIMNENAFVGHREDGTGNRNTTWLGYGDGKNTVESITNTYTYQIPVFKYTMNGSVEKGLKDATFILSKNKQGTQKVSFVKLDAEGECDVYRVAIAGETGVDSITTNSSGKFKLVGLSDTYYLTETKAPKGYNKLTKALKIYVSEGNSIRVDDSTQLRTDVKVENKSGTVLPSTGGAGTTMIYLVGAVLVLGSGVVLVTKRRVKNK